MNFNGRYTNILTICVIIYIAFGQYQSYKKHRPDFAQTELRRSVEGAQSALYNLHLDQEKKYEDYEWHEKAIYFLFKDKIEKSKDYKGDAILKNVAQIGDLVQVSVKSSFLPERVMYLQIGQKTEVTAAPPLSIDEYLVGMQKGDGKTIMINLSNGNLTKLEIKLLDITKLESGSK